MKLEDESILAVFSFLVFLLIITLASVTTGWLSNVIHVIAGCSLIFLNGWGRKNN